MKHDFLDKYSEVKSPIHRLDPRVKVIFTLSTILTLAFTPLSAVNFYIATFSLFLFLLFLSRIPFLFPFKRSFIILPFLIFLLFLTPFFKESSGSYNVVAKELHLPYSLTVFLTVSLKAWLSTLYLILLSSTTRFPDLLKALERLKIPHVLILTLSFMYRYIFVFQDEALRMKRARDARSREGNFLWHINSLGSLIGSLFIRAYERGERVYKAMLARGFNGEVSSTTEFNLKLSDLFFLFSSLLFLLTMRLISS